MTDEKPVPPTRFDNETAVNDWEELLKDEEANEERERDEDNDVDPGSECEQKEEKERNCDEEGTSE